MFKTTHLVAVAVLVLLCGAASGLAADAIVQVEEDWVLTVGVPNPAWSSPQLSCTMSPLANISSVYALFAINQRPLPTFQAGGLQLQIWNGNTSLAVSSSGDATLNNDKERITWTERMSLSNKGVLTFEIVSGSSQTWGNFGKGNFLTSVQTDLTDLNGYDPNVSATNSGVDFGNARVTKLVLSKVRTYTGNSKSIEKALDRVVYQHE